MLPEMFFRYWYCWGPTCFRISGSKSFRSFVSGFPFTTNRFSRTEKWTTPKSHKIRPNLNYSYSMAFWNAQQCCHPWTCWPRQCLAEAALLQNVSLDGQPKHLPNFLMADISFLSSLTTCTLTCFFFLLWVPTDHLHTRSVTFASNLSGVETFSQLLSSF